MISKELSEVLEEMRKTQSLLLERCKQAHEFRETEKWNREMAQSREADARKFESDLDQLQLKLRQIIQLEEKKYHIKETTIQEPKKPIVQDTQPELLGREG